MTTILTRAGALHFGLTRPWRSQGKGGLRCPDTPDTLDIGEEAEARRRSWLGRKIEACTKNQGAQCVGLDLAKDNVNQDEVR